MKKFSLMMIALLCAVVTFAAGPKKQFTPLPFTPAKEAVQLSKQFNAKPAPAGLAMKVAKKSAKKMRAPKKVASGTTLAGDYNWDYVTVSETTLRLDTMQTTAGSARITIKETEREDSVIISGMSVLNDIYALIETEDGVDYLVIPHQVAYVHQMAGNCSITGFFYYEGDDTYEEGWYYGSDIYGQIGEDGVITLSDEIFINAVVDGGQYAGYTILNYFAPSSTFTPAEELVAVTLPEGVEMKEYAMTYTDFNDKAASGTAYVGIDGTDVYIKGFSSYIPDALIKGTMDGNTVTFPGNQYLGTAYDFNSFFMEEAVFTYDAENDTYTAEGDVYSILGNKYVDVWATDPVLKGVSATPVSGDFTFNFNELDTPVSTNGSQDGDITEAIELTAGDVTLTISPKTESATNPNRFWGTKNGPQLRVYSGTLTFTVPEGSFITAIDFSNNAKWNEGNSADTGEFDGTTWTGSAQTVVITIAANTQINAITVTVEGGEEPIEFNPDDIDLPEYLFDFNDLTMQGWTTIDADGDGNDWNISEGNGSGKTGCVISESYINEVGALTPDNYLVSPKLKLDGCITFYAIAQDASYPAEHFSVEVSTSGNTDAADFKTVQEWTLTASRALRAPRKVQGNMYEYSVDLRGFEGQEGYVAIRHFNCTDNFYIVIDDIKIKTSWIELPDIAITPTEGRVESLKDFAITFNNYEVVTEGAVATLTNTTTGETASTEELTQSGKTVSFSFDEFTASGNYTLTVSGVKKADGEDVELAFNYYILGVVELPEGLETETWYFSASASESSVSNQEVAVAIDGSDIYIQGINIDYLPEAWVKGTIDAEAGTATFPTGQYFGAFEYNGTDYDMFFVGSEDGQTASDVVFDYDAEAGTLTTDMFVVISSKMNTPSYYEYYYDVTITREPVEELEAVEAPEDLVTETYLFKANVITNGENGARRTEAEAPTVTFDFNSLGTEEEPWPVSSGSGDSYDPAGEITEPLVLTEGGVALTISPAEEGATPTRFWKTNNGPQLRVYNGKLTFEAPEGFEMTQIVFNNVKWNENNSADSGEFDGSTWTGNAQSVVVTIGYKNEETGKWVSGNSQINSIVVTVTDVEELVTEEYTYQMQVGFDGNDVYFSGMNDNVADMWMKGTLSEDGKTVTIPASQYMGKLSFYGYDFDYFISAMDEESEMADIVLNYDAETFTFTTDQTVVLNGKKNDWDPYQTFTNVVITKMEEFAATPADPTFESYDFTKEAGYNKIYAKVPAEDVDGNELVTSKLFYIVWFEKDGVEQPYTFSAELYDYDFEEDVTEVPWSYDGYDIYKGGEIIYLEDDPEELATWTKVGIQSVYYGGGERNESNIVWSDGNTTTGIAEAKTDSKNAVIFDLQGRRVIAPAKGLYIVNGKKVVLK
ncbi:MAG: choice-of-anchor J domain-containing protein [Prevotella sp.]|nr:choice-of-anchor J domain-containing protein [Prevotella sp.]